MSQVKPIPAATVLLVRDGEGIEVVMGLRANRGVFGGVWVFPGGAVDDDDRERAGDKDRAFRLAAIRETAEEVGVVLSDPPIDGWTDPAGFYAFLDEGGVTPAVDSLIYLSNWVTPPVVPKRFDTRFFLVGVDGGLNPRRVSDEFARVSWVPAGWALAENGEDRFPMISPTVAHLRYVASFGSVADLIDEARSLDRIPQIEPRASEGRAMGEGIKDRRFRS